MSSPRPSDNRSSGRQTLSNNIQRPAGRARPVFVGPTYKSPQYHSKIWGRLIFFLFILLLGVVIIGGGGMYWLLHRSQSSSSQPIVVHARQGDTVTSIADWLSSKGYINSTLLFRLDARIHGISGVAVGNYTLRRNMSIDDMVSALNHPQTPVVSVTIPEGWRAEQIAARLSREGLNGQKFLASVEHPTVRAIKASILRSLPAGKSLQGYLFPDTYDFTPNESTQQVVNTMVQNLDRKFTPAMRAQAAKEGHSIYQVLILASIVEREARVPDERPTIASVYLNRLKIPMRLDADPTVQYTKGTPSNWWPVLQDLAANVNPDNPYNTYTHDGLPPTPIANPGLASIQAVLDPKPTNYLYFVACGHGRHLFATTLDEQTANQQKCAGR